MAIPAYKIVQISPRVLQAAGSDLVLNGLFLTDSDLIAAGQMKAFSTADDAASFFGYGSDEHAAAQTYFAGYDNSFKKPEQIFFGGRKIGAGGPTLRGAKYSDSVDAIKEFTYGHAVLKGARYTGTLEQIKAFRNAKAVLSGAKITDTLAAFQSIEDGSLSLAINGATVEVTDIDLSGDEIVSFNAVAAAIQTKLDAELTGTTCTYSDPDGRSGGYFTIMSPNFGADETITPCVQSELADLMNLTANNDPYVENGHSVGTLNLTINGTAVSVAGIDLSDCNTFSEAAKTLQADIAGAVTGTSCGYSADAGCFWIKTPYAAQNQSISYCSANSPLASLLCLTYVEKSEGVRDEEKSASIIEPASTLGNLSLAINGTTLNVNGMDFSGCTSFSDVAEVIQTKLANLMPRTTCTYNPISKAFFISYPGTGADKTITPCKDTALATVLRLTKATGAFAEQGRSGTPTPAETFDSLKGASENWALFTTVYEASADEALALSSWASAQGVEYLYICWSTDKRLKDLDAGDDAESIAARLNAVNAGATGVVYGDLPYAAFVMSIPASIDWDREQGVVTAAFKTQENLSPLIDNATEADRLIAKHCNFYGAYAARNDSFVWLYPGCMTSRDYRFLDPFWNMIWLASAIQTACMMGFKQTPRVPYNEDGYTLIRSWIQDPINRAKKSGIIDAGLTLGEAQKAQFLHETGMNDVALACLVNDGYFLIVRDGSVADRADRESPEVSLYITYAGSVQKLVVPVTMFV